MNIFQWNEVPMPPATSASARQDLRSIANDLARRLNGHVTSSGAMCRCPAHDDQNPSLSIRIGRSALLFKCFAGCETGDVLRALRDIDARAIRSVEAAAADFSDVPRETVFRERAREIWDRACPLLGSPAEGYMAGRGLRVSTSALRFQSRTPLGTRHGLLFRPAMIAAVQEAGRLLAIQRCFLDCEGSRLASDLGNPRRMLGRPCGGAVMLWPATETLGLAEGVETAMSAAALLRLPVWATLGAERLDQILIPETVRRLFILPDNDRSGRRGAAKAMYAYSRQGRRVETVWPPNGMNDWNDVLRAAAGTRILLSR